MECLTHMERVAELPFVETNKAANFERHVGMESKL